MTTTTSTPIIERIRSRIDVICYPTVPFAGSVDSPQPLTGPQRFGAAEKLLQAGLIEWSALDPGSTNIAHIDDIARGKEGFVYANPDSHIRYRLELSAKYAMTPLYAISEPGFMRLGAAVYKAHPGAPMPVYRLMFSDEIAFGFAVEPWALEAYLELIAREAPRAPCMVAGLGVNIARLIETTIRRGGRVRVGLEDAPMGCARRPGSRSGHGKRSKHWAARSPTRRRSVPPCEARRGRSRVRRTMNRCRHHRVPPRWYAKNYINFADDRWAIQGQWQRAAATRR